MPLDVSALGSLSTTLEELVQRLAELAADVGEDDEIGIELREVERQLHTASRRLTKATLRSGF